MKLWQLCPRGATSVALAAASVAHSLLPRARYQGAKLTRTDIQQRLREATARSNTDIPRARNALRRAISLVRMQNDAKTLAELTERLRVLKADPGWSGPGQP